MDRERTKSTAYFRTPPYNLTCAQAILKGFQNELEVSDQEIDAALEYRGGRAPGGLCGALYAANSLLAKKGIQPIDAEFIAKAGSSKCIEIKTVYRFPCPLCVELADQLVENKLKEE